MNEQEINRRIMWALVDLLGGRVYLDMNSVMELDILNNPLYINTEDLPNVITLRVSRQQPHTG